jgi:hypothetical protein
MLKLQRQKIQKKNPRAGKNVWRHLSFPQERNAMAEHATKIKLEVWKDSKA